MATKKIPEFTDAEIVKALRAAVAEKGEDYVYPKQYVLGRPGCSYLRNRQPSCLVANVLVRLGVSKAALERSEGMGAPIILSATHHYRAHHVAKVSAQAREALGRAQELQDHGFTWGRAAGDAVAILGGAE